MNTKSAAKKTKTNPQPVDWSAKFKNVTFVLSGRFKNLDKSGAKSHLKLFGGTLAEKLSATVNYLVVCEKQSTKPSVAEKQAVRLNSKGAAIQVIDQDEFLKLLNPNADEAKAMLTSPVGRKAWETMGRWDESNRVDLSGQDLRGLDLSGINLRWTNLDGADLRNADLSKSYLPVMRDVKLDGANLRESITGRRMTDCSLKKVDMTGGTFYHSGFYERLDFTGANLQNIKTSNSMFMESTFKNVDFAGAECLSVEAPGCDFTGANLSDSRFSFAKFKKAVFARAKMYESDLNGVLFNEADLRKADLRNAKLSSADFTDAIVDGSDFTGARLISAKLQTIDASKVKGMDIDYWESKQLIGPAVKKLLQTIKKAGRLFSAVKIETDDGVVEVSLDCYGNSWGNITTIHHTKRQSKPRRYFDYLHAKTTLESLWRTEVGRFSDGKLDLDSIECKSSKSALKGKALREIVLAAWCEAFDVEVPSPAELKAKKQKAQTAKRELRQALLEELRGGAAGIKKWNKHLPTDFEQAGDFRRQDLSKTDLTGIKFKQVDFQSAKFDQATLVKASFQKNAKFQKATFQQANLAQAKLRGVYLNQADFSEANLAGADLQACHLVEATFAAATLKDVDLSRADLRGADFSKAKLNGTFKNTIFDEKTRFPQGFVPPENMCWKGQGLPPAERTKRQSAGPIDLPTLMQRMSESVDQARLDKAIQMLKADKFRLFVQVEEDYLTGVVKSQSDASLVYSCWLGADGKFACCTQNLNSCGGLRGALCKHILVLIIGLSQAGEVDPTSIDHWVAESQARKPELDKDKMSETLLRYKGAEAGEIDWRPTETIPEDFYTF
jgi:uncharacterized protein YjbI with pentapeptide repeats